MMKYVTVSVAIDGLFLIGLYWCFPIHACRQNPSAEADCKSKALGHVGNTQTGLEACISQSTSVISWFKHGVLNPKPAVGWRTRTNSALSADRQRWDVAER